MSQPIITDSLDEVSYVHRISVGSLNPNISNTDAEAEKSVALLNRCLSETPKGRIIGREIAIGLFKIGDHQLSMQRIIYHVGFKRRPSWLATEN